MSCGPCVSSIPDVAAGQSRGCCCPAVWGLACRGCRCLDRLLPLSSCSCKKVDLDLTVNAVLLPASAEQPSTNGVQCTSGLGASPFSLCSVRTQEIHVECFGGVPATQLVCEDRPHVTIPCDCCYCYNPMLLGGPQGRGRGGAGRLSPQQQGPVPLSEHVGGIRSRGWCLSYFTSNYLSLESSSSRW